MKIYTLIILFIQLISARGNPQPEPMLPELFVQFPAVRDFTISPEEDEAYFTAQSPLGEISVIIQIKKQNNQWLEPQIAAFSGHYKDLEPFLSANGLRLYFASNRPLNDSKNKAKDFDIWYVERKNKNDPWSDPVNLGKPVNSKDNEFYPSLSQNNNLYFTSDAATSKGKDDIFVCLWEKNHYIKPVSLNDSVNSEGYEFNAYIATDESYIIFSGYNRKDGLGSGDLYISFKNDAGEWSGAKNLGKTINSSQMDYCPFVNPRTSFLYFTSRRSLFDSAPAHFDSFKDLVTKLNTYQNGLNRIYKVPFKPIPPAPKNR